MNVLRYGQPEPLPEQIPLRAGALDLIFENGDLRNIRLGNFEIINRLYVAVRDHNWATILPKLTLNRLDVTPQSFIIDFDVENVRDPVDFAWQGRIIGSKDSTITFTMYGEARSTFKRNRIGFCVLHPMTMAGVACQVTHRGGRVSTGAFPALIGPQHHANGRPAAVLPFIDMQELTFEVEPDVTATIQFEGELFETEDQRNWTDASYKTYGTSLRLPFPVEVAAGTRVDQSITLALRGALPADLTPDAPPITTISLVTESSPLPQIGLGVASHGQPLTDREIERLRVLNLAHLRVDVRLAEADYADKLRYATENARALNLPLEIGLLVTDEGEILNLLGVLNEIQPTAARWLIFNSAGTASPSDLLWLARYHLTSYAPSALFGGGSNANFTEANRNRPSADLLDFIAYAANPQVHAFDNTSIMETAAAHQHTIATARAFSGKPVAVGPITLKQRFNPVATTPEGQAASDQLPRPVDPRQMSLFGAAWTLAVLKYLSESGATYATLFETTGWRGVMETEVGSPLPDKFPSTPGSPFPVYHLLAVVGAFASGSVIHTTSSAPMRVEGLLLHKGEQSRLVLANLTNEPQPVRLNLPVVSAKLRLLDETSIMGEPQQVDSPFNFTLLPYATAIIDLNESSGG